MSDFELWSNHQKKRIEARLITGLSVFSSHVSAQKSPLLKAMQHGVLNGGKRVRALAVLAAGEWVSAADSTLLSVAAALEYMHAYSLIHDDLPSMDDDDLRRGMPTVHVLYGEAQALLAGDALQTLAFETLTQDSLALSPLVQLNLVRELSNASGISGMAGGQAIDLHHVGESLVLVDMQTMHSLKTGALLRASLLMGAMCGSPLNETEQQSLSHFADDLGLLFQVVDDILDASQNTATLGKTAGKDAQANKPTYVRELGLEGAREFVWQLQQNCLNELQPFGYKTQKLIDLMHYCVMRVK